MNYLVSIDVFRQWLGIPSINLKIQSGLYSVLHSLIIC